MKQPSQAFDASETPPRFALANFSPEEFQVFWPGIEDMLDKLPHTWRHWTKEWIYSSALSNVIQVWGIGPLPRAVFIFFTQINIYPSMRVLCVTWGAGHFDKKMLPLMHATLVNYAKLNDCSEISVTGRRGWEPLLRVVGMKREQVTWTLPVPNMRMN